VFLPTLEEHDHFTRRQKKFGAMEPNMKLMLRAGFAAQEASIAARFAEFSLSGQQREERVAALETATTCFDKVLNDWKLEVDSSIAIVKLELSKLNMFFDREAKAAGTPQIHDPVKGMVHPSPLPPNFPSHVESS
jgi:hypothetical protein